MADKDVTKLIRQIRRWPGWRVEEATRGYVVYPPDKSKRPISSALTTPSDHRWRANTIADLRRAGGPI